MLFSTASADVSFNKNLSYGMKNNPDVARLQTFLQQQGYYNGPVSGNYFTLTQQAVRSFQVKNNISPASGYFGTMTRGVVNSITAKSDSVSSILPSGCTSTSIYSITTGESCVSLNSLSDAAKKAKEIVEKTHPVGETTEQAKAKLNQMFNDANNQSTTAPIDYGTFSRVQLSQYANNPSVYKSQKIEVVGSVVSFLPKGGSGGTTNYINLLDPISNVQVMAEVKSSIDYTILVNKVKSGDTFRAYGIGTASGNFTNKYGSTVVISVFQLLAADSCDFGSSVTNLTSDSSPYGWTCSGTMQHVIPQ
ncbi:peptidoglycan-binding protein [Candidatus Nomurabacteria bacterium]|nr:peptidoglycan-binding protein [Candidatus Nomurabacteria bacterium]